MHLKSIVLDYPNEQQPSIQDILGAIDQMKNCKSPKEDNITTELIVDGLLKEFITWQH